MRNSPRPVGMGVVDTAKTGTEGTAETGAMGVVGETGEGISTSVTTPGPSKVSTKTGK